MSQIAGLLILSGVAYYAHKNGILDDLTGETEPDLLSSGGNPSPPRSPDGPVPTGDAPEPTPEVPQPPPDTPSNTSAHYDLLRENELYLNPWALSHLEWTTGVLMTENRQMNPTIRGSAGEIGLMQIKPPTADQMFNSGYQQFAPSVETLETVRGNLYFGTAYLDWLSRRNSDPEWIIKAYNGGPGWESLSDAYKAAREAYLVHVRNNKNSIFGS